MSDLIVIIDYGSGNVRSVANAFKVIGRNVKISRDWKNFKEASHIVLPGVGAFAYGMKQLQSLDLIDCLSKEVLENGKPFLGICLGNQLLASLGLEFRQSKGLGWINGKAEKIDTSNSKLRLPHIGWNNVEVLKPSPLYQDMPEEACFYFVHSYHLVPDNKEIISAVCDYGISITASVQKENIFGVQFRNGVLVQSKGFKRYQVIGNPTTAVKRLSVWASDELIYLDISPVPKYDLKRDDLNHPNHSSLLDIIREISEHCFMPLTFGGRIRNIEDIRLRLSAGADKITLNTQAVHNPEFITEAVEMFGSQCIVISIDVGINDKGISEVKTQRGKKWTGKHPVEWAKEVELRGAGEILLNSIDRDGTQEGYDIELINDVSNAVSIPVIAMGGVGKWDDFSDAITNGNASAVSAANIFHYTEQSVLNAKKYLFEKGLNVRNPELLADQYRDRSSVHDPTIAWMNRRN
jgi:imidazole glycerol-phosphate synthase subunit HisF